MDWSASAASHIEQPLMFPELHLLCQSVCLHFSLPLHCLTCEARRGAWIVPFIEKVIRAQAGSIAASNQNHPQAQPVLLLAHVKPPMLQHIHEKHCARGCQATNVATHT